MASVINSTHPTELTAPASAKPAIICDICRKNGGSFAEACAASPHQSIEKHSVDAGHFDCSICLDVCHQPVVTLCGHLFCWPCLYYWLSLHAVSQECPVCKANMQNKVVPLYGRGRAEQSENFAALMFPDIEIPCRPLPSRYDVPVFTNANTDGARNHVTRASEIHTMSAPSANVGFFASMLRYGMTSYSDGFFCGRARDGTSILASQQSFRNEKEIVFSWAFIFVASIAIVCFIVC